MMADAPILALRLMNSRRLSFSDMGTLQSTESICL
jgi:hypothetical protein